MTKREEREHLFKLLFCKDFHDVEELKEQIELYQEQQEIVSAIERMFLFAVIWLVRAATGVGPASLVDATDIFAKTVDRLVFLQRQGEG